MGENAVFRAKFVIAWPIWAGGYRDPLDALALVTQYNLDIWKNFEEKIRALLGRDFCLLKLDYEIGTYCPIGLMSPDDHVPNSFEIFIVVGAPISNLLHFNNLESRINSAIEELAGLLFVFCLQIMPGVEEGASIYDVSCRWDPEPALVVVKSGEAQQKDLGKDPETSHYTTSVQPTTERTRVFISYCHRDAKWLNRLQVHLVPLGREWGIRFLGRH